jgi:maleate cis-trans isomerase
VDVQGFRRKFGVLGPSTNTIVQPEFEGMRPCGVTNHYSRIFTPAAEMWLGKPVIAINTARVWGAA